ncbi:hypothetical protein VTI74DRAFT_8853 [Chaetomium olivicolor]
MARGLASATSAVTIVVGPTDVTCVNNANDRGTYTAPSGATYQILCATDYAGSDISATTTSTFAGCIDACDSTAGCVDVSYVGQSCYLKKKADTALQRDWVWTAKQVTAAPSASKKLSCDNKQSDKATYTTSTGAVFQVLCGADYAGGMSRPPPPTRSRAVSRPALPPPGASMSAMSVSPAT